MSINVLDCTFRDGGYYNAWNFSPARVNEYLEAMRAAKVDIVELGFRFLSQEGFKGAAAFTTDDYLRSLNIPPDLTVGAMINASDLLTDLGLVPALEYLFPEQAADTPLSLVRIAAHFHELEKTLPAVGWLHDRGYHVGYNLMQIADRTQEEVAALARLASDWPVEVLYFADSMGSMTPQDTTRIIGWLREGWDGPIGIHTHDNMGLALSNTLRAQTDGATWLDATVTGMGRGPGNARTEELVIEAEIFRDRKINLVPLMSLIQKYFGPMKETYGWGTNPYYYLAGKYGIHPTYIQEMLGDARYDDEDILAVIDHLREAGGKKFSFDALEGARHFYRGEPRGTWSPIDMMHGRDILILGTGPGIVAHRPALEAYIRQTRPLVLALNTQSDIDSQLIDMRIACHPVRLLADAETHAGLPHPLITPASMLPQTVLAELNGKELLDFGLHVEAGKFGFHDTYCIAPASLVLAYALAVATSGHAARILMAGFDGYPAGDRRNDETASILDAYRASADKDIMVSITPTTHRLKSTSVYAMGR
tara:strand:+ start:120 stop:1730 length:1611 start_codon:yes stop_codon:yes gene_type:complete